MDISKHIENRVWAFHALDGLQAFLDDPDFEGNAQDERAQLERKRKELEEGKYRVVFLGSFNVGKSALINALLGDEYLPTVLEECTTKITHIVHGDAMEAALNLHSAASEQDVATLRRVLENAGVEAVVSQEDARCEITITFATAKARDLLRTLRTLTTVNADEDFPQLKALRDKFDEVFVRLPNPLLPEDVALVDSPGVHSINETNTKIAEEIVPHSHVVVCLIDSQSAGNEQNRDFVEQIVRHRHRKLFFVINKSDQLNLEEIDLDGRRGPAKDLFRSLDGVVSRPETFFLSSLYALVGAQLAGGKIDLGDLDENRKIKIPMSMMRESLQDSNPCERMAAYLLRQSNIEPFKSRLIEYLYKENREGAILESVCRFLDNRAWTFSRPIEIKLEMAKDVPRLDELDRMNQRLADLLADTRMKAERVTAMYGVMSGGGDFDETTHVGYESIADRMFSEIDLEQYVMQPVGQWLAVRSNVKKARKHKFAALREQLESAMDAYLERVLADINTRIEATEQATRTEMGDASDEIPVDTPVTAVRGEVGAIRSSLAASYVGFGFLGIIVGGGIGAALGYGGAIPPLPDLSALPPQIAHGIDAILAIAAPYAQPPVVVGAAVGKLAGLIAGLLIRALTATRVRRNRLAALCRARARQLLARADNAPAQPPVLDQLKQRLAERRDQFGEAVRDVFVKRIANLTREIGEIQEEAEALREKKRQTIARLEPKLEDLAELRRKASEIAEANAPRKALIS